MQVLHAGVEVLVHGDAVAVELELRRIEQGLLGGEAGNGLVHCLHEADDAGHGAVGQGGGDVARHRVRQGGPHVGVRELLRPGALAVQHVAEALHQDVSVAKHVAQAADVLGVGNGLVEGRAEVVRAQDGQVGVVALELLVGVAVHHRQAAVVVLLGNKSARVLAEGADLVLEGAAVANELALVQDLVHVLDDLVAHLYAHANVHRAGLVLYVVARAGVFQPAGTAPAGGNDHGAGVKLLGSVRPHGHHAAADAVLNHQVLALGAEAHLHPGVHKVVLNGQVELLGLLRPKVADGAVHQLEAGLDGAQANLPHLVLVAATLHVLVRAKLQVQFVHGVYGLLGVLGAYELGEVAAHLVGERELAVREGARAREARCYVAGVAAQAAARADLGAVAALYGQALLQHDYVGLGARLKQLEGAEDAGRAGADYDDVIHDEKTFPVVACPLVGTSPWAHHPRAHRL